VHQPRQKVPDRPPADSRAVSPQPPDTRSRAGDESAAELDGLTTAAGLPRQPPERDPLLGSVVGGVRIVRLLAEGGMGRVYEGAQEQPARPVAVKVLRPALPTAEARRRFHQEVEILASLDHPGIARIYTAGSCDLLGTSVPYFVMELVPGARTIVAHADAEGLPAAARIALLAEVCDAVAAGHARGIVHRDLKPGNVLVDASGRPRVIDFGVARWLEPAAGGLTTTGQFVGTLRYTSPEQLPSTPGMIDARSDVYALGIMLHELLAGQPPDDLPGQAAAVVKRTPAAPAGRPQPPTPRLTPAVERIVARCLARDPADRFPDAAALAAALRGGGSATVSRRPWVRRLALAGLLGGVVGAPIIVARGFRRPAGPKDVTFRFDLREPPGPEVVRADRALINAEPFGSVVYWAPMAPGEWAEVTYRLDAAFPIAAVSFESIGIHAANRHADVMFDRFAEAHLDVSPDGARWTPLAKSMPAAPLLRDDEAAAAAVLGSGAVFLRARLYESASFNRNRVHYAQFLRSEPDLGRIPALRVSREVPG